MFCCWLEMGWEAQSNQIHTHASPNHLPKSVWWYTDTRPVLPLLLKLKTLFGEDSRGQSLSAYGNCPETMQTSDFKFLNESRLLLVIHNKSDRSIRSTQLQPRFQESRSSEQAVCLSVCQQLLQLQTVFTRLVSRSHT